MNNPYDIIISRNENATSFVELNDQYNALYNLLINNQRQISYLDLYKITEYINTPEESIQIGSKFAQLNPNTAIGIGVPSVKFNGEEFYQGDLLLKLSNGQMQKLDAPSHGIYFPKWKEEGTSKKLIWVYSKEEPKEPTDETIPQLMTNQNEAESLLYREIPPINTSNGYGQKILRPKTTAENTNWDTTIISVTNLIPISTQPIVSGETITYNNKIIVERKEDKLYYYLYNLPNNFGISIKGEGSICYILENKQQEISLNSFVYHNENKFIITTSQKESSWVIPVFSGETVIYNDKTIVERKDDKKLYYNLFNLPNNSGIRIREKDSICYEAEGIQKEVLLNNFVYRSNNEFIITEDQKELDNYLTIDWEKDNWIIETYDINNLIPIIKSFKESNEEVLADIKIESTITTKTNDNETIITNIYQVSNIPYCVSYLIVR